MPAEPALGLRASAELRGHHDIEVRFPGATAPPGGVPEQVRSSHEIEQHGVLLQLHEVVGGRLHVLYRARQVW